MCAYKFRLEPIVSLKKRKEDERKTELAVAKEDLKQKESRLVNLCRHREVCRERLGETIDDGDVDVQRNLIYYAYMERLADEIADHISDVARSRDEVETRRGLLLESSREKKTLEKLKEKDRGRYMLKSKRDEQTALDETACQTHTRKGDNSLLWSKE
jgi:flagellar FliJ protein